MLRRLLLLAAALSATLCLTAVAEAQVPVAYSLAAPGAEHPADVTVTVSPGDGSPAFSFSGMRLHGVVWFDRREPGVPWLDLEAQTIRPIRALRSQPRGTTWSASVRPTGRQLGDVCELAPDEHGDSAPSLNWCLWLRSQARQPGMIDTLRVPAGVYRYAGPVLLRDSVHVAGAGGAVRASEHQDAFGNRYTPVLDLPDAGPDGRPLSTTFRQLDATPFTFLGLAMLESSHEAHAGEPPLRADERLRLALRQDRTAWYLEPSAAYLGLSDLHLDGGGESDLARLVRAKRSPDPAVQKALQDGLQNSPSHSGAVITVHGGLDVRQFIDPRPESYSGEGRVRTWADSVLTRAELASGAIRPDAASGNDLLPGADSRPADPRPIKARHTGRIPGAFARLSGVSVTGYAATGLLGDYGAHWTLTDVYGADCLHNHTIYKAEGDWDHVTLEGYSWHHVVMQGTDLGTVRDLVIRRMAPNPAGRETGAALDIRMDAGEDQWIDGLYADLRGFPGGYLADVAPRFYDPAPYANSPLDPPDNVALHLRDAVVVTPAPSLVRMRRAGPVTIDDVRVHAGDPERFELASPGDRAGMVASSAIVVLDTVATQEPVTPTAPNTIRPPTVDPPEKGPSLDPRDARIAELEAQAGELAALIEDLRRRLAAAPAPDDVAELEARARDAERQLDATARALAELARGLRRSVEDPSPPD